jgi:hypothetical protein
MTLQRIHWKRAKFGMIQTGLALLFQKDSMMTYYYDQPHQEMEFGDTKLLMSIISLFIQIIVNVNVFIISREDAELTSVLISMWFDSLEIASCEGSFDGGSLFVCINNS